MLLRRLVSIYSIAFSFFCRGLSCKIWMSSIQHKMHIAPFKQNKDVLMVNITPSKCDDYC